MAHGESHRVSVDRRGMTGLHMGDQKTKPCGARMIVAFLVVNDKIDPLARNFGFWRERPDKLRFKGTHRIPVYVELLGSTKSFAANGQLVS